MAFSKVMIIGNLGRDPEMRYTPNGRQVTEFSVAVTHRGRDAASGEWADLGTDWFRVTVWGDRAERAAEEFRKGNRVFVEGRFRTREYDAKDGTNCLSNQVLYHLGSRGIDHDLVADHARRGIMIMAYSPLGQGAILRNPALAVVAKKRGVTPAAIAIAWTMRHPHIVSIPKASNLAHVKENVASADLVLDADDLKALDAAFPPPKRKQSLGML